jgi:hypothetical protein
MPSDSLSVSFDERYIGECRPCAQPTFEMKKSFPFVCGKRKGDSSSSHFTESILQVTRKVDFRITHDSGNLHSEPFLGDPAKNESD